jgi:TolB-like protein
MPALQGVHETGLSRADAGADRDKKIGQWHMRRNDLTGSLKWRLGPGTTARVRPVRLLSILIPFFLLFFSAPVLAGPEPAVKIVVFPFENLTEEKDAEMMVMPVVREQLEGMAVELADEESVNRVLFRKRFRDIGFVSLDVANELRGEVNAGAVLLGSIVNFISGDSPQIGLVARLIDTRTGQILWADHAAATGTEFTGLLGLGEIKTMERLIPKAVSRLLGSFSTEPPSKQSELTFRIAVMPFRNYSEARGAGMMATYMSLARLHRSQRFEPVEYGEVRKAIVRARIRGKGEMDYKTLEALSKELNVDGILLGTVETYPKMHYGTLPPKVEMTVRLLDAREKRILWYDSLLEVGEKSIILFSWEQVKPADETAYLLVSKIIRNMESVRWR